MALFHPANLAMQLLASTLRDQPFTAARRPPTDIYRTRDGWLIKMELAGVRKEDIEVSVEGDLLVVRGCRRDTHECRESQCHCLEISYSSFERRLELPCDLHRARFEMESRDGMLWLQVFPQEVTP